MGGHCAVCCRSTGCAPSVTLRVIQTLERINGWLGKSIAYLGLLMAVVTLVIVVLRYGFDTGSIALQESLLYMHGTLFMIGLSYAMQTGSHVRVDILYSRLSPQTQRWINLFGHLIFLIPLALVILVYSWDYVSASWRVRESSPEAGGIPAIFLLKTIIPFATVLLILQALCDLVRIGRELRQGDD